MDSIDQRLRQADASATAATEPPDPKRLANQVNRLRAIRRRRRQLARGTLMAAGLMGLAGLFVHYTNQPSDVPPTDELARHALPAGKSTSMPESESASSRLQSLNDKLAEIRSGIAMVRQQNANQQMMEMRGQRLLQLTRQKQEIELDALRERLSQSVFFESNDLIVSGF
jgi:hypothetical protein